MGGYLVVLDDAQEQFTVFNDSAVLKVLQGPALFITFSFRLLSYSLSLSVHLCVCVPISTFFISESSENGRQIKEWLIMQPPSAPVHKPVLIPSSKTPTQRRRQSF